jgi:uncharacterized membrane protein
VRGHKDLRLLVAVSALCALLAVVVPVDLVRLVFALPLALFLPGYAIAAATFARRPVEGPMLVLLGAGLSLAVLPLGAIVLNYAPDGIGAVSWALLLVLIVIGACRAAAIRRPRGREVAPPIPRLRPNAAQAGIIGLAALAAVAALVLAFIPVSAKHAVGYTELWIQPSGGGAARIGVRSNEQEQGDYRLVVRFGSSRPPTMRRFALDPGEGRVLRVASGAAAAQPVSAALFLAGNGAGAYRRVSALIPSTLAAP